MSKALPGCSASTPSKIQTLKSKIVLRLAICPEFAITALKNGYNQRDRLFFHLFAFRILLLHRFPLSWNTLNLDWNLFLATFIHFRLDAICHYREWHSNG